MARTAKNAKSNTPARPRGRPSNKARAQRSASAQDRLVDTVMAAASAAASAAVKTMLADGSASVVGIGTAQSSQPSGSQSSTSSQKKSRGRPGAPVDPNSNMSKVRDFIAKNRKMERSALVDAVVDAHGISKAVVNTYVSKIEKENGEPLLYSARRDATNKGDSKAA
jgi:hypothetical protein